MEGVRKVRNEEEDMTKKMEILNVGCQGRVRAVYVLGTVRAE